MRILLFLFLLGSLAACVSSPSAPGAPATIGAAPAQIQAKLIAVAQGIAAGMDAAVDSYVANPAVTADLKAKLMTARTVNDALVASLPAMTPATFLIAVNQAVGSMNAVVAAFPIGALPPPVAAGVTAFEVAAAVSVPLIQQRLAEIQAQQAAARAPAIVPIPTPAPAQLPAVIPPAQPVVQSSGLPAS